MEETLLRLKRRDINYVKKIKERQIQLLKTLKETGMASKKDLEKLENLLGKQGSRKDLKIK